MSISSYHHSDQSSGKAFSVPSIDLNDLDIWARGVPHDWFAWLRRNAPVYRHPEPDGPGFWVITRWADVTAIERAPHLFANSPTHIGLGKGDEFSRARRLGVLMAILSLVRKDADSPKDAAEEFVSQFQHLLGLDAPDHSIYRRLLAPQFSYGVVKTLEPTVRSFAQHRIKGVIERGRCDLVDDLVRLLPMDVISELLGVPREDQEEICRWSNDVMGSVDPEYAVAPSTTAKAMRGFFTYFSDLRQRRAQNPERDIVSILSAADIPTARFLGYAMLLVIAGNETTRNAIVSGLYALMTHGNQWEELRDNPGLMGSAIEEILRLASPVAYMRRNVIEDVDLYGTLLRKGEVVSLWYPSANRDESVFESSERFDVHRTPNPHVAFGGGGPHFCLGAALARLEIRVMIEEVTRWMPDMRPDEKPVRLRSNQISGIKHLAVSFTPRSAAVVR